MGVTFIAPAEQFTSPAVLISKEITEDGTYYAADDNANGYSSVEVSVGGGGSGDLNTATVTLVGTCSNEFYLPVIEKSVNDVDGITVKDISQIEANVTIPLYKGCFYCAAYDVASVSGDAEIVNVGKIDLLFITGDCTITKA